MNRILITGATGLLGRYLLEYAPSLSVLFATGHHASKTPLKRQEHDLLFEPSDIEGLPRIIGRTAPDVVIHCASIGSVDMAERQPQECRRVNVDALQGIIAACERQRAKLVFVSSNAVYDGEHPPYGEDAVQAPANRYGELKAEGERLVSLLGEGQMIVRPILMFGWNAPEQRPNPVTWQLELMAKREVVPIVHDKFCNPLYARDCAASIWAAIGGGRWGQSFNIGGPARMSRYELGLEICRAFGYDSNCIEPVSSDVFAELAPRPNDTTYDISRMRSVLKVEPRSVAAALGDMRHSPVIPASGGAPAHLAAPVR